MEKIRVLCYGDSNTYAHDPARGGLRMAQDRRWTGVLSQLLGESYTVIEEGLCGRTTVLEDPVAPGRNGLKYLIPCLQSHAPLDWLIFMLGTNDLQCVHSATAHSVAAGMEALLQAALNPFCGPERPPRILLISPVWIGDVSPDPFFAGLFGGARDLSRRLAPLYAALAKKYGCDFLDAAAVAEPSALDGLHLDEENHRRLAVRIASMLKN